MRTVVKSHEVAHLWAHQTQLSARTPGNMSFDGPDFFSYSTVIGTIVTGKDGRRAYLVSDSHYSVSTSSHQNDMRCAIPSGAVVYRVPGVSRGSTRLGDAARIMDEWTRRVSDLLEQSARSRKPKNARLLAEAAATVESMREFAAFMGLKRVKLPKLPGTVEAVAAAVAAEDARKERAQRAADKRRAVEFAKRLEDERARLAEWEAGAGSYPDAYNLPTALRVIGDTVETSRGASFPVAHALRGLALVDSVRARGEEWRTNGHTCHLGHYRIDRIAPDGTVYAGCHVVPFAAIERIRPALQAAAFVPPGRLEYVELGGACDDCAVAIANDDYTGMDEDAAARVRAGIERAGHPLSVGDEMGFSWQPCAVCGGLAGNRHAVGYLASAAA